MCGGTARVITSRLMSPTYRGAHVVCTDPACAWTGTAHLAIDRTLSPGLRPRPEVSLEIPNGSADDFIRSLFQSHIERTRT
jgi:hypothetical protein